MPTVRGRSEVRQFIAGLPEEVMRKLLPGAGRAAAKVIAEEAKDRCTSDAVKDKIKTKVGTTDGRVIAKVQVNMGRFNLPIWLEYGTAPHFISVDESQNAGMSIGRINEQHNAGSLVINGEFVGATVFHPGARPHPFLRPALDVKAGAAIAAAQQYINSRVDRSGIKGSAEPEGDED